MLGRTVDVRTIVTSSAFQNIRLINWGSSLGGNVAVNNNICVCAETNDPNRVIPSRNPPWSPKIV
jgi:hypothetical protein